MRSISPSWFALFVFSAASSARAQMILPGPVSPTSAKAAPPAENGSGSSAGSMSTPVAASPVAASPVAASAVATSAAAVPPVMESESWSERDQNAGESMTKDGSIGLIHTRHAQGGSPGQFRVQFLTEYFSAGFLCSSSFPCPPTSLAGGAPQVSHSLEHIGGQLALGVGMTKWLEGYASTSAYANSTAANRPALLQVLGDSNVGLKAYGRLGKVLSLGGAADLWLLNGTGAVGLNGGGTSARFHGLATIDLRAAAKKIPARFSFNATYSWDNSGELVADDELRRGSPITRIERFGLRINRVDHFDLRFGAEGFLADSRVRPFVELGLDLPVNRQGYACRAQNLSGDRCLATETIVPSRLTLGARVLPWKKGLSLTAAFDVGVDGTATFIEEMSPTPPWTLYLGAGWAIDTKERPAIEIERTKLVEKVVEADGPKGRVLGQVRESNSVRTAVANAVVAWANHPEHTSLVTNAEGRFSTFQLTPGEYVFAVRAEGYKPGECTVRLEGAQVAPLDCVLEALPRLGVVIGHIRDEKNEPVPNATVKLRPNAGKELQFSSDALGQVRFTEVPAGAALVLADADNFIASSGALEVKAYQERSVDVTLRHRTKAALVSVDKNEIRTKQQIQFEVRAASILPASNLLLDEVADALIKNPRLKQVEIQVHTDNAGVPESLRALSEERAASVRSWLIAHGVAPERLVAKGYGDTKPVAANVTPANRSLNRRVQFVILERDTQAAVDPTRGGSVLKAGAVTKTKAAADGKVDAKKVDAKKVEVKDSKPPLTWEP